MFDRLKLVWTFLIGFSLKMGSIEFSLNLGWPNSFDLLWGSPEDCHPGPIVLEDSHHIRGTCILRSQYHKALW